MPNQIKVPPPPNHSPITQEEANVEWKNWFSLLYDVLESKGILSSPSNVPGGDDPVFWHKFYDPSWAHLGHTGPTAITVTLGQVIAGWEGNYTPDWQLESDPVAGTITISTDKYDETGYYSLNIGGFAQGTSNEDYYLELYANGAVTGIVMPISFKGSQTTTYFGFNGIVQVASAGVLDIRLAAGSGTLSLLSINWSIHRVSPIVGS